MAATSKQSLVKQSRDSNQHTPAGDKRYNSLKKAKQHVTAKIPTVEPFEDEKAVT